jgi:hypothetical protein
MLTEYQVRLSIAEVEESNDPPLRKARRLMRLSRIVRGQASALRTELHWKTLSQDRNAVATLKRLDTQTLVLEEDIRRVAEELLTRPKP